MFGPGIQTFFISVDLRKHLVCWADFFPSPESKWKNSEIHQFPSAMPCLEELFFFPLQQTIGTNNYLLTMQIIPIDYPYTYTYPLGYLLSNDGQSPETSTRSDELAARCQFHSEVQ